jgi:hypothetical protein
VLAALEGLLPGGHEPEGIEPQDLGRDATDDQVTVVNGVERSAEEAYRATAAHWCHPERSEGAMTRIMSPSLRSG